MASTIYIVGSESCKYTKDAWDASETEAAKTAAGVKKIQYIKADCSDKNNSETTKKLCSAASGYPSFMTGGKKTCTRGFKKCAANVTVGCGFATVNGDIVAKKAPCTDID